MYSADIDNNAPSYTADVGISQSGYKSDVNDSVYAADTAVRTNATYSADSGAIYAPMKEATYAPEAIYALQSTSPQGDYALSYSTGYSVGDNEVKAAKPTRPKPEKQYDYQFFGEDSSDSSSNSEEGDAKFSTIDSGVIHLPNHLTTKRATGLKWNLSDDVRAPWDLNDFDGSLKRLVRIDHLYQDFIRSAILNAKILVQELFKNQHKIAASDIGGIAGGQKFVKDSILFKFNLDSRGIYGGSYFAFKSGRRELVNTMLLSELLDPDYQNLSVPLFAIVDYCGYQVSCVGLLPLNSTRGLCYGSADGGRRVFNEPTITPDIEALARELNLAPHVVGQNRVLISHCVDIEVHKGTDGKHYIIDTARMMPPEYPNPSKPKSVFYYTLRPEFVRLYHKPLCPDALSVFLANDPNKMQFNEDIREATEYLINDYIPRACRELDRRTDYKPVEEDFLQIACELDPTRPFAIRFEPVQGRSKQIPSARLLTEFLHHKGINFRHLGLVYYHLKNPYWKNVALHEIVSRTAKNTLRSLFKYTVDEMQCVDETALLRAQVEFLNLLFGHSVDSDEYWENEFSTTIYKLYFTKAQFAVDEMIASKFLFKPRIDKLQILKSLSSLFQHTFVNENFVPVTAFNSPLAFHKENLNSALPETCHTNYTLGRNLNLKKYGAIFTLIDSNGKISSGNYANVLKQTLLFFEDAIRQWYSNNSIRTPVVIFYELLMITKLQKCALTYDSNSHAPTRHQWLVYYDKLTVMISLCQRYMVYNRIEYLLDTPLCFEKLEKCYPGGLKEILLSLLANPAHPRLAPMPSSEMYATNYGNQLAIYMLLWRLESRAGNLVEANKAACKVYCHVRYFDVNLPMLFNAKPHDLYRLEDINMVTQKKEYTYIFMTLFPHAEKLQHVSYVRELVSKYSRDTSWHTVRLLLLSRRDKKGGGECDANFAVAGRSNYFSLLPDELLCRLALMVNEGFFPMVLEHVRVQELRKRLKYFGHNHPYELTFGPNLSKPMCVSCNQITPYKYFLCTDRGCKSVICYPCWEKLELRNEIDREMSHAQKENTALCTYEVNGTEKIGQQFRRCEDCNFSACLVCAASCHKGHRLGPLQAGVLYCDCYVSHGYTGEACKKRLSSKFPASEPMVSGTCTFHRTQRTFAQQLYYKCDDCNFMVCTPCAVKCHKDHKLSHLMSGPFYCDCSEGKGKHGLCQLKDQSLVAPEGSNLPLPMTSPNTSPAPCTFLRTGRQFSLQSFRTCLDCDFDICLPCSSTCHKGHNLGGKKTGNFFCDCYERMSALGSCLLKNPPITQESKLPIPVSTAVAVTTNEPKDPIKDPCTFARTGKNFSLQEYHKCLDCGVDCCLSCSTACHKGHRVGALQQGEIYCDCYEAKGIHGPCKLKQDDVSIPVALSAPLTQPEESAGLKCTFEFTGKNFRLQKYYKCLDCHFDCCTPCYEACHKGHNVGVKLNSRMYCDCYEAKGCCRLKEKDPVQSPSETSGALSTGVQAKPEPGAEQDGIPVDACTYQKNPKKFEWQDYYKCLECRLDACIPCTTACHRGHQLSGKLRGRMYCDCFEANGRHGPCRLKSRGQSTPSNTNGAA